MKKKLPELLNRFIKIKETGGLTNPANVEGISEVEYKLLEKLLAMGDNDFHTKKGILVDHIKAKSSRSRGNQEGKGFILLANLFEPY